MQDKTRINHRNMKKIIYIIASLIFLTACGHSDKELISDAENLVKLHPDSALKTLNKVENLGHLSDEWVARYWLAMAEGHTGMNEALSEDSAVLFSLNYYENHQPVDRVMLRKAREMASSYYWWKDKPEKARLLMERALAESKKLGNRKEILSYVVALADLAFHVHDLKAATRYSEMLMKLDGGDRNHTDYLDGLAAGYYYHGDVKKSNEYSLRAIATLPHAKDSAHIWILVIPNYADVLIDEGKIDEGIRWHEKALEHYRQSEIYKNEIPESIFSLSHAYLLKGDKQRAKYYMDMLPRITYDDYRYDPFRFNILSHKMVLDYALTGKYNVTDIAEYANGVYKARSKREAIAKAKQESIRKLREHELLLLVTQQKLFIFFLLLTLGQLGVIFSLSVFLRCRKKKILEKDVEMHILNNKLQKLQQQNHKTEETSLSDEEVNPCQSTIVLTGTTNDTIKLQLQDVIYLEAVGNYVKVFQLQDGVVKNEMIRSTLKQIEQQLSVCPMIVRCHRAFLVNLQQVERILSKSSSMQLLMKHCNETIPVSRSNMAQIKEAIKR